MLPQGIFSVAITTVLFPTLARFAARSDFDRLRSTMANGTRQILLLLVPAAASILVLAEPMTRLVYERGVFDAQLDRPRLRGALLVRLLAALLGVFLLQTRTFFSLQRPWVPTARRRREPHHHRGRRAPPLRAVRDRRHRRRHQPRDDHERPGRGRDPPPRARPPRARAAHLVRLAHPRFARRSWPRSPTSPGTRSTRRSVAASAVRSSRWASRWRPARSSTAWRSRSCACRR